MLTKTHMDNWINKYGSIPNNSVILVKFGWSKFWPDKTKYFGINKDQPDSYNFPGNCNNNVFFNIFNPEEMRKQKDAHARLTYTSFKCNYYQV